MESETVSVIVPVYKVEPYLRKCLDSIVNQTYKNLEIILVDDGSPDNCGSICDEYAKRDYRIRVIHQKNNGVSSARNEGLKIASGDWIGWVDSDDWIEPDMFEYLLENVQKYKADIAVCSRAERYRERCIFRKWNQDVLLNTEEALELLLKNNQMQNYLWDKLWRRNLFQGIVFPEGKSFEDIAVMHRLFERADKVICLSEWKYNYNQRVGSIVDDASLQNRINHFTAAKERLDEMSEKWPQFLRLLEAQCVGASIVVWCSYYVNSKEERKQAGEQIKEISAFAKEHREAWKYTNLGRAGRMVIRLIPYPCWWSFAAAHLIGKLYKLKHGRAL